MIIKVSSAVQYGTDTGDGISGFTYGIIFFVGMFFLVMLITFACTRLKLPDNLPPPHRSSASAADHDQADPINNGPGLHESTLGSAYPKLLYSETTQKGTSADSSCAICLVEYKEKDMLRLLPDCEHLFHPSCIDPWMRLHPTCPICRRNSTPVPGPHTSIDLIPVVDPLATRQGI